jgi:hypothetical protein
VEDLGVKLMRSLLVVGAALLLVPELLRYRAERRLYRAEGVVKGLLGGQATPTERQRLALWASNEARTASGCLPADSRPLIVAGSARLLAGQGQQALDLYLAALRHGERAEIDLNLARAWAMLGDQRRAEQALLRTYWVNPEVFATIPQSARVPLEAHIQELERRFAEKGMSTPPPLPLE